MLITVMNITKLKVFTWNIHGNYLYYLTQARCKFYLPISGDAKVGYGGKTSGFDWGDNVFEIPVQEIEKYDFDCLLYQSRKNYLEDQFEILSKTQRAAPKIYLEHNPPKDNPYESKHLINDPEILTVHVTHFNNLMWHCNNTPTKVIEHGVVLPTETNWQGDQRRGVVVINGLLNRGRRMGLDLYQRIKKHIPLDLVGIGSEQIGGLGEIRHEELPKVLAKYRFIFNPARCTSLPLAIIEAMMVGVPVVSLATTEMVSVIENGVNGFIDNRLDIVIQAMANLLDDYELAKKMSLETKRRAVARFNVQRFAAEWEETFQNRVSGSSFFSQNLEPLVQKMWI